MRRRFDTEAAQGVADDVGAMARGDAVGGHASERVEHLAVQPDGGR